MGRTAGQAERVVVDTFIVVPQRRVSCHKCGSLYIGTKAAVVCPGCNIELRTFDALATKRVPTGVWSIFRDRQISNSSIIGEVIADGSGDAQ